MRNQYHLLVVDDNYLREKGRKAGRKKGPGEGPNIGNPRGGADPILGQARRRRGLDQFRQHGVGIGGQRLSLLHLGEVVRVGDEGATDGDEVEAVRLDGL